MISAVSAAARSFILRSRLDTRRMYLTTTVWMAATTGTGATAKHKSRGSMRQRM